ncbi:MAG TPA: N-formylglutamate amidohydrolase [Geminicoccaceae bacterium]|nr:N-formylglutamate amidohydrolase [Geminicoccus sp.]HMU50621.1 N-formylglutamate amidohydrolase [Geminicoccaceae bacterium]
MSESGYPPFRLVQPSSGVLLPVVLSSPHSGGHYPAELLAELGLQPEALRSLEDGPVDRIAEAACGVGATLIAATFPRAYVDLNRHAAELDPELVEAPHRGLRMSAKVRAGLGVIPSRLGGRPLYDRRLTARAVTRRLHQAYRPYHERLAGLLDDRRRRFGTALLLDCHSMPSAPLGEPALDVVLGDRFGRAAHPDVASAAEAILRGHGLRTGRNRPYAGGFITEHYGRPADGVSALQIELRRGLFLDEWTHEPLPGLGGLPELLRDLVAILAATVASCGPVLSPLMQATDSDTALLAAD